MKHPLVKHHKVGQYLVVWAVVITAHAAFLYSYFGYEIELSLIDSFSFNLLIAGLSFSYGYAFRYISMGANAISNVVSYASLVLAGVLIVLFGYKNLMHLAFEANTEFILFIDGTMLWRITVAGFYLALVILVYYLLKYSEDLEEKATNESRLEQIIQQTALDALKSQLNPHFIFNSLNSISSLTISNPEKAQEMVIKLSDFLRSSLREDSSKLHPLKQELENMQLYLDIERTRFGDRLQASFDIEESCKEMHVPNMILQPLYENAIKYGLYETLDHVEINTQIRQDNNTLVLTISNPYDPTSKPPKGRGIGLKNTTQRLKLLYDYDQLVTTSTTNDSFSVTLHIPIQ